MQENNVIKSITAHACPHCNKDMFIENQIIPPFVGALFTPDMVTEAKGECLKRIKTLTMDDEKRDAVVKWINDPNTIFGPAEVENIMLSLAKSEE